MLVEVGGSRIVYHKDSRDSCEIKSELVTPDSCFKLQYSTVTNILVHLRRVKFRVSNNDLKVVCTTFTKHSIDNEGQYSLCPLKKYSSKRVNVV